MQILLITSIDPKKYSKNTVVMFIIRTVILYV
jgi:hypothetical protein